MKRRVVSTARREAGALSFARPCRRPTAAHRWRGLWVSDAIALAGKPRPLPKYAPAQAGSGSATSRPTIAPNLYPCCISSGLRRARRQRFHVSGFSLTRVKDAAHQRIRTAFDEFHDVFGATRRRHHLLARKQKIDIAIDLTGYTTDCRPEIFARRAAPIQVNFLGYPGNDGRRFHGLHHRGSGHDSA